jgi:hypothetical protein
MHASHDESAQLNAIRLLRNRLRNLMGIRLPRAVPRRGRKPSIGVGIACGEVRMVVQAGMSDDLWLWLLEQGWRELTYRPDRRVYRQVPPSCATKLTDAAGNARARALDQAVDCAELRSGFRVDASPVYVRLK